MDKESVYLRPMTLEDSERVVGWRNKGFVRKNFIYQKLFTVEGQREWYLTQVKTGNVAQFIVCLRGGRGVGSTYLRDIDREKGTAEYGIFLGEKDILGQGIGTLAAQKTLDYAFGELGLEKVFLRFLEDNIGAGRSYEHAGFRRIEGREEQVHLEDGVHTVLFMEICREEWQMRMEE